MATIKQVAEKAGVSTATVSRLLNENGFISDEARRKIKRAMKETGFDPVKRKRRVVTSGAVPAFTHKNVLMVWNINPTDEHTPTGQNMMQGVTEALQSLGTSLTIAHMNGDNVMPAAIENGRLDGILIHGRPPSPEIAKELQKFPVVWLLRAGSTDYGDRVQPDHGLAGEICFDWLVKQGCRNLCCLSYELKTTQAIYTRSRATFFMRQAQQNGIESTQLTVPEPVGNQNLPYARAAAAAELVEQFTRLDPRPDGMFVTPQLGREVHFELSKRGIVPMKDLLLIAGDEEGCIGHHLEPAPAMIRIFSHKIGKQAVEMLLQRIKNPDMPQMTCALKPKLIVPK